MKKRIVFAFLIGVFVLFSQTSAQVFNGDEAKARIDSILENSESDETKINILKSLEESTQQESKNLEDAFQTADQNLKQEIKPFNDDIEKYKEEIAEINEALDSINPGESVTIETTGTTYAPTPGAGRGVTVRAKLSQRKTEVETLLNTTQTALNGVQPNLERAVAEARTSRDNILTAIGLIQNARIKLERGLSAQESIKKLQEINKQSSSFNTGDFLSVGGEGDLHLDGSGDTDTNLLDRILVYIIQLVGTFAVIMLIIGGAFMITADGDDNRLQKGKNIFIYTIIGILVAFTSYALIQFVLSVLFQ